MKLININPQDRRWIARWLRSNLVCVFVAGCLLLALRVESTIPVILIKQANANSVIRSEDGISVPPQGWRRTANGWEHVSGWQKLASPPLGELVLNQRQREAIWIQTGLRALRQLPPLAFALLQLIAIAAIVWVAEERKKRDRKFPIAS